MPKQGLPHSCWVRHERVVAVQLALQAVVPPNDIRTYLSTAVPTLGDGPLSSNMRLPINHSRMSVLPA